MASPTLKRTVPSSRYPSRTPASSNPPDVIDPRWLAKAAAITIVAALLCAYLTLCLLVYQGQWQLVLHPVQHAAPYPADWLGGQAVRFGSANTGQPRLAGVWLPAAVSPELQPTILYLPDGSGSLIDDGDALESLHRLPFNILAFDYRGFGGSDLSLHPNQARMSEDAETALDYLTSTRHINPRTVIPYGAGLGASLAAALCVRHGELPALIAEAAVPNVFALARADSRASIVPLRLLFHQRFEIAPALASLRAPKLLLTAGPSHVSLKNTPGELDNLYRTAATPSLIVHLPPWQANAPGALAYREAILRFLDEYLPSQQASPLVPH